MKKVLFCVPPKGPAHTQNLLKTIQPTLDKYIGHMKFVKDMDEYAALTDDEKKSFDINVVQLGTTCAGGVLKD